MSYRVLCDEHVPESAVTELAECDIVAVHVTEKPGAGCEDSTVAAYARDNGFVLLTNDDDFLDDSTFPGVRVLYYPDNAIPAHVLATRVAELRSLVSDPADLGRVTFISN